MPLVQFIFLFMVAVVSGYRNEVYNDPHYLPGHDVMVHMFEWKWKDIADECEQFLGPVGYGGVQVSPITENVVLQHRPWYERYQPISYKFITRSGNEDEFRDMVRRCNTAGVRIYVDAVINHMAARQPGIAIGTAGTIANPYNKSYKSVPYENQHFHETCDIYDYMNAYEVRFCELVGLPDLAQSEEYVRDRIVELMNRAIAYGVAGFRIDAAKHMLPADLKIIYSRLHDLSVWHGFTSGSRPYIYQEVIDTGGQAISKYEYTPLGAVTEFGYGMELSCGMRGGNPLKWFRNIGPEWALMPHESALVFIDNHDNQRGHGGGGSVLTHKSSRQYKMANAFMLAHTYGQPQIMSSFAFDDPNQGPPADGDGNIISPKFRQDDSCEIGWICEHRWRQIYNMVKFRIIVEGTELIDWWDNWSRQIAFSRGDVGFIAINAEGIDMRQKIRTRLSPGNYCDVISGNIINGRCMGKVVTVDQEGFAYVEILMSDEDGVLAIHKDAKL